LIHIDIEAKLAYIRREKPATPWDNLQSSVGNQETWLRRVRSLLVTYALCCMTYFVPQSFPGCSRPTRRTVGSGMCSAADRALYYGRPFCNRTWISSLL